MLMEEEVPGLLRAGLFIVMVPVVVLIINLRQVPAWRKERTIRHI